MAGGVPAHIVDDVGKTSDVNLHNPAGSRNTIPEHALIVAIFVLNIVGRSQD
jgi:hypothetical protein